jgi:23S rRNA (uracil1939-C5)-methyltransferase
LSALQNLNLKCDGYTKMLLDPPRTGALEVVNNINIFDPQRIVYISCNPATLARDSGILVKAGYTLKTVGIIDMFPHTKHVEAIALFMK